MTFHEGLKTHLQTGCTTVARAWTVTRRDGVRMGFTDHDCDLVFDGMVHRADTGLTARALQQSTGLSVDNSEAMGALSSSAISEADIASGRFDGAEISSWLVNWANTGERQLLFRGSLGEIRRSGGAFEAELRGLSEALNRPLGRVFQKPCSAVLGDGSCGFDVSTPGYSVEAHLIDIEARRIFRFGDSGSFDAGWFQRGSLEVLSGSAKGLKGAVKRDRSDGDLRIVELWEPMRAEIVSGDKIRVIAGCDKRFETCRLKFANQLNFQGFPDIPEEDWVMVHPSVAAAQSGGSRR